MITGLGEGYGNEEVHIEEYVVRDIPESMPSGPVWQLGIRKYTTDPIPIYGINETKH